MNDRNAKQYPLRLARPLKEAANALAAKDGISLNHFIAIALAEKISRAQTEQHAKDEKSRKRA